MNRVLKVLSVLVAFTGTLSAQPMSGSYTVGGATPDFATPQDAANALKVNGVSGPVLINIRPGTYVRQGSPGPVIRLDTVVLGVSPTNRITFQPDVAAGGNPSNVILQIDCDVTTDYNRDREIVYIGADYTTFRNLTFRDVDSVDSPARFLVRVEGVVFANPTVEGFVVDGCTFVGSQYYPRGQQFGTDMGIYSSQLNIGAVSNNRFSNLMRAISLDAGVASPGDSINVRNNGFDHLYSGASGAGTPLGTAIEVEFAHVFARGNRVSQSSGATAINVIYPVTAVLEANEVQGSYNSELNTGLNSASQDRADSVIVLNNVLVGPPAEVGRW